ncbi:hypothetical protein TSUD_98980 [Trifolium subterraneum]|uniref:Core Histone H2A/H2B/H3 domain-containing protein n=1 Tax=Trifolium subterraneum TaxID=3900 RepID=A0A2Z6NSL3_TRISU|nr:hypothetical protein TSUD_98980 [Trifolium subterraneum]
MFWANQMQEIEQTFDFKNHTLPLARIKKIMKADEDVRMISAEAPVVFAKACEMFILELTLRSWIHTEENKRRTLQKNDVAAAIARNDVFDFLVDIIPRDELKEEGLGIAKAAIPIIGAPADMPYYFVPPQHHLGPTGRSWETQLIKQHCILTSSLDLRWLSCPGQMRTPSNSNHRNNNKQTLNEYGDSIQLAPNPPPHQSIQHIAFPDGSKPAEYLMTSSTRESSK